MPEGRPPHDALARIIDSAQLARAVPLLGPEVLQAAITHWGLQDCGELLALATPQQLSAVFDLDLWKAERAGEEERFDATRFLEWLEVLVDAGPAAAADRLAAMDCALVVAGLSPSVRVFDPAVFSPEADPTGADPVSNAGRDRGVHAEVGGYLVVARQTGAWDVIVEALVALEERHRERFDRVMQACRRLSDSGRELDGLDDRLSDAAQVRFDLSRSREERRDRLGFLPPQEARAFLESARRIRFTAAEAPEAHPVFTAHQRSAAVTNEPDDHVEESSGPHSDDTGANTAAAVAGVVELLRDAGVLADPPRALLSGARDETASVNAALHRYLDLVTQSAAEWMARHQELAFLANALVAGCSVQGRPFTWREAADAVAATCNLGLERWPRLWAAPSTCDLVTVFQVGWSVLHHEVSMTVADQVVVALDALESSDSALQFDLRVLRRELFRQQQDGTPWRARDRLEVLAPLDLPAWAALTALFDECPVMLTNVSAPPGRRLHTLNPSEFRFIGNVADIAAVHAFVASLAERLTG